MKKLRIALFTALSSVTLLAGFSANATMSPYIEQALIQVCKSAQSNRPMHMSSTIKGYRLTEKTVATKVMCNGSDIISFAHNNGALKTAVRLERKLGTAKIVDLAKVYSVNY